MHYDQRAIERFPRSPGVYIMKGTSDEVIYVGKASNLRARVSQYFGQSSDTRIFVGLLDRYLTDIEVILTANEKEALILENELIKRHQPRFNVNLKDDKNFLHLRIDTNSEWPRIDVVRRPRKDGAHYFGPYHSASKIRKTLKVVEQHFGLRNCDDLTFRNRSRPCLQYQIKRCPGPCVLPIDKHRYDQHVHDVIRFLNGREAELVKSLEEKMSHAADAMEYELAARYRDQIRAVSSSLIDQNMVQIKQLDQDVYGIYREGASIQLAVLLIRSGKMVGSRTFEFEETGIPDDEMLSTFTNLFYNSGTTIPDEVLLPAEPRSVDALATYLSDIKGRKVQLKFPQRGASRRLIEMASKNAEHAFFQARRDQTARDGGLVKLKDRLQLTNVPHRMECFDISIFQGSEPVGSCVRFEGGAPMRGGYRHYTIKEVDGTDDYGMMREVLFRRLKRGLKSGDLPHLIIVDGGKGQLNVALAVLKDLEVDGIDVVGLAKARVVDGVVDGADGVVRSSERVFLPGVKNPVVLKSHSHECYLMTQIRDEAHRFAITHHRKRRLKKNFRSSIDDIPGIGPSRRAALLRHLGSLKAVREASLETLSSVPGFNSALAERVYQWYQDAGNIDAPGD
ncbi:MAG: excinuclease ABC subunit UvrC [Bradymonadia bacterium]